MSRHVYTVDDVSGPSLADIAAELLDDEYGNEGLAAVALQEAGYTIRTDDD